MNSKKKGNRAELELLHLLEERSIPCRRNEQGIFADFAGGRGNPDIQARIGGQDYHIECKRTERFSLYPALEQAQRDAVNMIPVVMHRANRKPWVVILTLEDFLDILNT